MITSDDCRCHDVQCPKRHKCERWLGRKDSGEWISRCMNLRDAAYFNLGEMKKVERRMRAAESLLEDALLTYHNGMTTLQDHTADQIRAHLEAARKEDER